MSIGFTLIVIVLIFYSGPTSAITLLMSSGGPYLVGRITSFTASISIDNSEIVPITSVALIITKPDGGTINCSLPYTNTTTQNVSCTGNQNITVTAIPESTWQYGYGYAYSYGYMYGYAYDNAASYAYYWDYGTQGWGGYGYGYLYGYSYDYQYGYYTNGYATALGGVPTQLNYSISWRIPSDYNPGVYSSKIVVYAENSVTFSSTQSDFTVSPLGPSQPYPTYGYVNYTDHTHPSSLSITLTNLNTTDTLNLGSLGCTYDNATGYFQMELSSLASGYLNGDYVSVVVNDSFGVINSKTGVVNTSVDSLNLGTFILNITVFPATINITEFMPNPVGADNASMPAGEWVELYNSGNSNVSLQGWKLMGSMLNITASNTNRQSVIIPARSYIVVYRNGDPNFELDNTAGYLGLRNSTGFTVDNIGPDKYNASYFNSTWTAFPEGFSVGRNESGSWNVFSRPTPGMANWALTSNITLRAGWNLMSLPLAI